MSAPNVCECVFCGNEFGADGIKNHQTWCDSNPHRGTPVQKQQELGIFEPELPESEDEEQGAQSSDAHPNQSQTSDDRLPERDTLSGGDKDNRSDADECPNCGSSDTITSSEARQGFREELREVPTGLERTLAATERYCNDCFAVYGGQLEEPHQIVEEEA